MTHKDYMHRAICLAEKGRGNTLSNPLVGCVIVYQDQIIGEGYHRKYEKAHAEVNAINAVKNQDLLEESTLYVTLEPCSHHGKTPPCVDLILQKKIKTIFIATTDPFLKLNGRSKYLLESNGMTVNVGLLENEAKALNKKFFTFHFKKRPYVILKWAQSYDGFLARKDGTSKWISSSLSRQLVHKWRSEEDSILVGKNTVLKDDPRLTSRKWKGGKNPTRIILDTNLSIPENLKVFNGEAKTIVINGKDNFEKTNLEGIRIKKMSPNLILEILYDQNLQSVLIEGGSGVLRSFLADRLWDEARIFIGKDKFQTGLLAPLLPDCYKQSTFRIKNDTLTFYKNEF